MALTLVAVGPVLQLQGCGGHGDTNGPVTVNPAPSLAAIAPMGAVAGAAALTLTATGADFTVDSTVDWNGVPLATSYVSATQLTALVPGTDLATPGAANVSVVTPSPGGGTSTVQAFTITATNPVPSVGSIVPSNAAAGSPQLTLTVNGSDFVTTSIVDWNGAPLTTTFVSASQLTAVVPVSNLANAGPVNVTVVTPAPGGGTSSGQAFTITSTNPVPVLASISPASAAQGSPSFTLTANGGNFAASSTLAWNGAPLQTTFVSAMQLTAVVPASNLTNVGSVNVTVVTPSPGGGISGAQSFSVTVTNPVPTVTGLSPASVAQGAAAFPMKVSGTNFVAASTVDWNGTPLATSFLGASQLTAMVPASDLVTPATADVTVVNPAPGGGTSAGQTFTVTASNPAPTLTSLSPTSAVQGGGPLTVTANGGNFVAASTIDWNGTPLATTYVSASQLTALIPASDLATAGSASVTVANPTPGGGTSSGLPFAVNSSSPNGAYLRQSAQYIGYPNASSTDWTVTLQNVQAGSTIYVVGTWPNAFSSYPTMAVTDGTNSYTLLDRHDDLTNFAQGVMGTQSMGHWYAVNVQAGTFSVNMSPTPPTIEDWVALTVFEIAGVSAQPLDAHTLNFQATIPPGKDTVQATVTSTVASGIVIAMTFDDIDFTAPTAPLAGTGYTDAGAFWDFTKTGKPAARAAYAPIVGTGPYTAVFSPQEGGSQDPDYMTCAAIFH